MNRRPDPGSDKDHAGVAVGFGTVRLDKRAGLLVPALGLIAVVGLSAHAAYRAIGEHPSRQPAPAPRISGYERQDHFPGAALLYAAQETAAPAVGVTGTTDLPALPMTAADVTSAQTGSGSVVPAAPFATGGAAAIDRARALLCLTTAVYYEAASEPDAGQRAVAQVILNRVRHPAFPASVCGVVYQGVHADGSPSGCQFSFACDGATARSPARSAWVRATRNAGMMLAGYVYAPVGLATHYHTYAVTPSWNRSLVMTDVVGAHFFHRWKGEWGTAAAFSQRDIGREPVPGGSVVSSAVAMPVPLAAGDITNGSDASTASAVPAAIKPVPSPFSEPQPGYAQSGAAKQSPAPATDDTLPPSSEILERWKDSGKPL